MSKGTLPAGIQYWQPDLEPLPPLFSYFPANTLLVNTGDLETVPNVSRLTRWRVLRIAASIRSARYCRHHNRSCCGWTSSSHRAEKLAAGAAKRNIYQQAANANLGFQKWPQTWPFRHNKKRRRNALRKFLESFDGPVVFSVESEGRREALGELLARIKIAPQRIMRLDEAS